MLQLSSGQSQHTALMLINVCFSGWVRSSFKKKKFQHDTWIIWFWLGFGVSLLINKLNHEMRDVSSAGSSIYQSGFSPLNHHPQFWSLHWCRVVLVPHLSQCMSAQLVFIKVTHAQLHAFRNSSNTCCQHIQIHCCLMTSCVLVLLLRSSEK